ncbi:hypothetical protein EQ839_09670 [Limosilactobacillus mucosae]|nr:hypothetical protein EQ839_09670 [Limosilactobacillus mucosae]
MMFLYFCLWLFKSLSQMAFYFSNLILQTATIKKLSIFSTPESTLLLDNISFWLAILEVH